MMKGWQAALLIAGFWLSLIAMQIVFLPA